MNQEIKKLNSQAEKHSKKVNSIIDELKKVVVGQEEVMEKIVIGMLSDGHILLEGVPGLAKTLMVRTLGDTSNSSFSRIQFTPDLLPADIIGTKIYNHHEMTFKTKKGPIFHNFILADEINRAPPKVQSALLEAMQERQVSIQGDTFKLSEPFLVMATQNPIETEGTYKLPEAQVDRFFFKILLDYPTKEQEKRIIRENTAQEMPKAKKVVKPEEIKSLQKFCRKIYADPKIEEYASSIVDATRNPKEYGVGNNGHIEFGASPRASISLILGGKAHALLQGRGYVTPEDIKPITPEVLRHRIILTYEAEAEDITPDHIINKIIDNVKVP